MPKYRKRQLNKKYRYVSTQAESFITYLLAKNSVYFGNGGTSFVLEDANGVKVRFVYTTRDPVSFPSLGGYFKDEDDIQPRFIGDDINNPTNSYEESGDFFGYGWNQDNDTYIDYFQTGTAIKIFYGDISALITSSDLNQVATGVEELVVRTSRAINFVSELKIAAYIEDINRIRLLQVISGPAGNTDVFRGYATGFNAEGSAYDILTSDITTESFSGGTTETITYFDPKSGILSRAYKKILKIRNSEASIQPHNETTSRFKSTREFKGFNDLRTNIYLDDQNNVDARTRVKLKEINVVDGTPSNYLIYSDQNVSSITSDSQAIDLGLKNNILSNTDVFDISNLLETNNITKSLKSSDYEIIKREVNEESYSSFTDFSAINSIDDDLVDFNNSSLFDGKNIYTQKQITFNLDFSNSNGDKDAVLVNTDMFMGLDLGEMVGFQIYAPQQFNFTKSGKISTINSLQTAYWNSVDNEWNYLDFNKFNVSDNKSSFAFPVDAITTRARPLESIDDSLDKLSNKNICFTPAYRPINFDEENVNTNRLSQITKSYGFPTKYNWQPHNNHTIKLSDYISQDFYVEKVIIKGNLSVEAEKYNIKGNTKFNSSMPYSSDVDFNTAIEGISEYNTDYVSSGLNFFILKEEDKKANLNFPNLVSYFEGNQVEIDYNPSDVFVQVNDHEQGYLEIQGEQGFVKTDNLLTTYQRIISNKTTEISDFHKEEELYLKENSISDDLYNKFFKLEKEQSNSVNTRLSIHDLQQPFSEANSNLNANIDDADILNNSDHYQIIEKFSEDKAYLKPNKNRELLTYSSILFFNSQDNLLELDAFKEATFGSHLIIENTSNDYISIENRKFEVCQNINSTYSKNYIDSSIYTIKSEDHSNACVFNILEGKTENIDHENLPKQQNNTNRSDNYQRFDKTYTNDNNLVFDSSKNIFDNKISAAVLKPSDTLVFGVNAYANGNLVGSITKLHNNLSITLIGKEVNSESFKNNYSNAINRTVTQKNTLKYKNIVKPAFEDSFSYINVDKKTFVNIKKRKVLKDTLWPSITSIFRFFDKQSINSVNNNFYPAGGLIFSQPKDYYISNDTFTDEEIQSNSQLSRVLTLQEWKNFNIFTSEINNTTLVSQNRKIDKVSIDKTKGSFLNYDCNGFDGNTVRNLITSKMYDNVSRRFNIDYSDFSQYVTSDIAGDDKGAGYAQLVTQINGQDWTYNKDIFGNPLEFSENNDYKNILTSNFNINDQVDSSKNFTGFLSLQKPKIFNKWCLVPLVENVIDGSNPENGCTKIVALLRSIAIHCYNEDREKYFNYLGVNTVVRDDSFKDENDLNPAVFYYMYEFKIKLPVRIGKVYKEFTTIATVRTDLQGFAEGTQTLEDINVVIPLEYYETGEFGYRMSVPSRDNRLDTTSILEISEDALFSQVYDLNDKGINNYSLFNVLHKMYYDFNINLGVNFFLDSYMESYMFYSQQFHKFWQSTDDYIEALDTLLYNNQVSNFGLGLDRAGISGLMNYADFYKNYVAIRYDNLNIDTNFKRIRPDVVLSDGSAANYNINAHVYESNNSKTNSTTSLQNYLSDNREENLNIQHMFISKELVPNFGIDLITSLIQGYQYKIDSFDNTVSPEILQALNVTNYLSSDSNNSRRIKQYFNFNFNNKKQANLQSLILENYEKTYFYNAEDIRTVFKYKDNFYNLNFEDSTPLADTPNDLFSRKNKSIDILSFNNSYFTTQKDVNGIYDVVMDIDGNRSSSSFLLKDPIIESYNKNNNESETPDSVYVRFPSLQYDYKTIRQEGSFVFRGLPLVNLSNHAGTYFDADTADEKSKCVVYGISKDLGFAIKKIDKFKYGILTPYIHKNRYYLCNLNNNKQLNKLSGTKNYAYYDIDKNTSEYTVKKLFINSFFVYYNEDNLQSENMMTYNTDRYARQTSGFVDA